MTFVVCNIRAASSPRMSRADLPGAACSCGPSLGLRCFSPAHMTAGNACALVAALIARVAGFSIRVGLACLSGFLAFSVTPILAHYSAVAAL